MAAPSSSVMSSNMSFPYSVTSINSRKSRKSVLYPRRVHPPPVAVSPECIDPPDLLLYPAQMLTWEVRYLCATLLPHSETRLLPAGIVLLKSLGGQGRDLSEHKNEELRHCSELFILLTREIHLKDAIGIDELEGACKLLHITFRDILFDTPTTSDLIETGLRAPRAETQGPELVARVFRALLRVMDVFEAALDIINPPAVSDEVPREHYHQVSLKFSAIRDLTMDQYRKVLGQKLAPAHPFRLPTSKEQMQQVTHRVPSRDGRESIGVAARDRADVVEVDEVDTVQQWVEEVRLEASQPITTIAEGLEAEDTYDNWDPRGRPTSVIVSPVMDGGPHWRDQQLRVQSTVRVLLPFIFILFLRNKRGRLQSRG
ncbi:hypothetical protein BJY52DRAFT_163647 [Lactarius psammicola]|nr:hypothetical protein BJY52DRAFT_163647 [Lactarius psammicola]